MKDSTRNPRPSARDQSSIKDDARRLDTPALSVVIVSYMNEHLVHSCLNSLNRYNDLGAALEVVLVDNSPNHEVAHYLATQYDQGKLALRVIRNQNFGFGEGNNVGIRNTAADIVMLLNPDTQLIEPVFHAALDHFHKNPALATLGVQLQDSDGSSQMSFSWIDRIGVTAGITIKLANRFGLFIHGEMFTSGAAMFIRRDAFDEAGEFDENIFLYNEERDLFRRIAQRGYSTGFDSTLRIIHLEGSGSRPSVAALRHRLESLQVYCTKHHLDYPAYLRADLRVARAGILLRYLRDRSDLDYARERVKALERQIALHASAAPKEPNPVEHSPNQKCVHRAHKRWSLRLRDRFRRRGELMKERPGVAFVAIVPPRFGIYNKVQGQIAALKRLQATGELGALLYLAVTSKGTTDTYVIGGAAGKIRNRSTLDTVVNILWRYPNLYWVIYRAVIHSSVDVVYVRRPPILTPATIVWLVALRLRRRKIFYEIPTYPYDREFTSVLIRVSDMVSRTLFRLAVHRMVILEAHAAEAGVIASQRTGTAKIFGVPVVTISNSVDFDMIPLRRVSREEDKITITSVSSLEPWHRVDRLLAAVAAYVSAGGTRVSAVNIVGEGPELCHLRETVARTPELVSTVTFHGPLYDEALREVFDATTLAVGVLEEPSSRGFSRTEALKHREYAARGIPFIHGLIDPDFLDKPYALQVPEGPIDLRGVIQWVDSVNFSPEEIRADICDLTWDNQFRKVLESS